MRRFAVFIAAFLILSACGRKAKVSVPPAISTPTASAGGLSRSELEGFASYYAEPYHGRRTASGEIFDSYKGMTAAHRTLPFNTIVRVTNKTNSESVDVRINDRGPFVDGRVIDLSFAAAQKIDLVRAGVAPVKLSIVRQGDGAGGPAPTSTIPAVYAVQVGAFANERTAQDLKKRLSRKFSSVSIETVAVNDTTIYRVRIGNEPDLVSAQRLARRRQLGDGSPSGRHGALASCLA